MHQFLDFLRSGRGIIVRSKGEQQEFSQYCDAVDLRWSTGDRISDHLIERDECYWVQHEENICWGMLDGIYAGNYKLVNWSDIKADLPILPLMFRY